MTSAPELLAPLRRDPRTSLDPEHRNTPLILYPRNHLLRECCDDRVNPGRIGIILQELSPNRTTFYDFPEEHWKHIRTTNVVESPFAALRLRTG